MNRIVLSYKDVQLVQDDTYMKTVYYVRSEGTSIKYFSRVKAERDVVNIIAKLVQLDDEKKYQFFQLLHDKLESICV